MTLTEIQKTTLELESVGVIYRTGEFRRGRPVWAISEFGRKLEDACRADGSSFSDAVERLLEQRNAGEMSAAMQATLPLV